ncbi:helix-turn-helix domain-containing protein [Planomicrobium okeanokoites]|uniref:Helix-turn-helix domain-containing protein n=1 Tax=Planomicrobium okeanokoites TaxID=244 RepID=A0ABV7KTE3_PLAOK|nr:helix-turn-helix domain-containing protein [Planomicrobium okeanokoites]TAA71604.1 helix-turn-helix domain-containing protein [Planomicrobium okeanokoites]
MAKGKYEEWLEPEKLIIIEGWARDGLTDEQIAHNMGIGYSTLQAWKSKYQDIQDTLKRGKEVIDRQVENALLKNALGFHYKEEALTNKGEVVEIEKFEKPNTTAQIFWLKNRKSKQWRDKQDIEHSGSTTQRTIDLSYLSDEELEKALKKYDNS